MGTFDNHLLSSLNRLSMKLEPVTFWLDALLERLAPKATASAYCSFCGWACGSQWCIYTDQYGNHKYDLLAVYDCHYGCGDQYVPSGDCQCCLGNPC